MAGDERLYASSDEPGAGAPDAGSSGDPADAGGSRAGAGGRPPSPPPAPVLGGASGGLGPADAGDPDGPDYVYALGTITTRFPTLDVEKEFAQAVRQQDSGNLTDRQLLHRVLSLDENRYLAREMCWTLSVENLDAYVLLPRSDVELVQLVDALEPVDERDVDVVVGVRGPLAPPEMCNGLQVPILVTDKIYSFTVDEFVAAIPRPDRMEADAFETASRELFSRIMQLTDNLGSLPEHRALNYVALRYPAIYETAVGMFADDRSLARVSVQPSRLANSREVVNVILTFQDRNTGVEEKRFTRVDVTGKYPFLVSPLQPFYDR